MRRFEVSGCPCGRADCVARVARVKCGACVGSVVGGMPMGRGLPAGVHRVRRAVRRVQAVCQRVLLRRAGGLRREGGVVVRRLRRVAEAVGVHGFWALADRFAV